MAAYEKTVNNSKWVTECERERESVKVKYKQNAFISERYTAHF